MSKHETMTFCESDYKRLNGFSRVAEVDYEEMYEDIKYFIRILVKNGYQMRMWYDGLTIVIEYNYKDESMSGVSLEWLGDDEYIETCPKEEKSESKDDAE